MENFELDELDEQIIDLLVKDGRISYSDVAKKLIVSPGTVNIRIAKMKKYGVIKNTSLNLDYNKLGYSFIAYIEIYLAKTGNTKEKIDIIRKIPYVTVAHLVAGKFDIFCKIRVKNIQQAKEVIFKINTIDGIIKTETLISLEEVINDKKRLIHELFTKEKLKTKNGTQTKNREV